MPLIIPEGKIRPELPLLAAKFATECNIAVRNHVHVLQCWKDYKKKDNTGIFQDFVGKVGIKFHMDTEAAPVMKDCTQMKSAVRQQRYKLKQKYFDPFPLNLEICKKNKANRAQVKFHQTTGSRSYPVHCDNLTQMEEKASQPTKDGQQPISAAKVVSDVLTQHTKKPKFLQHVGIQHMCERSSGTNLEAHLAAEKKGNAELQEVVNTLTKKVEESAEARARQGSTGRSKAEMDTKHDFFAKLEVIKVIYRVRCRC